LNREAWSVLTENIITPKTKKHFQIKSAIVVKKVLNEEFVFDKSSFYPTPSNVDQKFCNEVKCNNTHVNVLNNGLKSSVTNGLNNDLQRPRDGKVWTTETFDRNVILSTMVNFENRNFPKTWSRWLRIRCGLKKISILLIVGAFCFMLGVALPFMICKLGKVDQGPSVKPEGLSSRPVLQKSDISAAGVANVLSNLLITVKTTHNFHYPRVVILLETWVSLVRSQVKLPAKLRLGQPETLQSGTLGSLRIMMNIL